METIIEITRLAGDHSIQGVFDVVDEDALRLIGAEVNRSGVEPSQPLHFLPCGQSG